MRACIDLMADTFKTLANGESIQPLRYPMWLSDKSGLLGMMPGFEGKTNVMGIKVVSVFPQNHAKGLSSHQGVVLLFESETGTMYSIIDGDQVTAIRTAAASAVATRLLSREDAAELAILGSGVQAATHLEAIKLVRTITTVTVWSRNYEHAQQFIGQNSQNNNDHTIIAVEDVKEAVGKADIICTTTSAKKPILKADWVSDGTHINAVGACTSSARELDSELVAKSMLYTDCRESICNESGDFLFPKQEGLFDDTHIMGEIGEIMIDKVPARKTQEEITLFKSLGLAVEDLAACQYIYEKAKENELGTYVNI